MKRKLAALPSEAGTFPLRPIWHGSCKYNRVGSMAIPQI
jgi:hypothetical protein